MVNQLKKKAEKNPPNSRKKPGPKLGSKQPANLPPPIEPSQPASPVDQQESNGLLSGLTGLFSSPKPEASESESKTSSIPFPAEHLSPESERLLAAVPDVIGDDGPEGQALPPLAPGEQGEVDELMQLVGDIDFQQEDIQYLAEQLFEMIAEMRQMEHWKLTDRQSKILARPLYRMVNAIWAKLVEKLPDYVTSIPGLAGTCLALGIVAPPKILKDRSISIERAQTARKSVGSQAATPGAAGPAQPKVDPNWKPIIFGGPEAANVVL